MASSRKCRNFLVFVFLSFERIVAFVNEEVAKRNGYEGKACGRCGEYKVVRLHASQVGRYACEDCRGCGNKLYEEPTGEEVSALNLFEERFDDRD